MSSTFADLSAFIQLLGAKADSLCLGKQLCLCGTTLAVARYAAFPKISLKKKLLLITFKSKIKESLKQDPIWLEQPPAAGSLPQDAVLPGNGALYMLTTKHFFGDISFSKDIKRQLWSMLSNHYSEKELYKE